MRPQIPHTQRTAQSPRPSLTRGEYGPLSTALLPFTGQDKALRHLRGIAGRRVRIIYTADLAVAVSKVPRIECTRKALRWHLEDFSWLGAARIHRSTVDALAQHTSVLPLKLATVHRDQELWAAMVAAHHQHFTDVLTSLAGQQEWEVTVYALPVEEPPIPPLPQATRSDQAFLPVHDQSYDAGHHQREALAAADRLHRKLTGRATASRRHPQSRARLTDEPGTTISSTAYLVRRDQAEAFTRLVKHQGRPRPRRRACDFSCFGGVAAAAGRGSLSSASRIFASTASICSCRWITRSRSASGGKSLTCSTVRWSACRASGVSSRWPSRQGTNHAA
ncbi:GvpL/GvpF family gas vesicle protein [Streptomyces sp. NPDC006207]